MAKALESDTTADLGGTVSGVLLNNLKFTNDIGLATENPSDLQTLVSRADTES